MKQLSLLLDTIDKSNKKTIAIAVAADKEILETVKRAIDFELATFLLYGNKREIVSIAHTICLDLSDKEIIIIDEQDDQQAVDHAVKAVHSRSADVLMKGNVATHVVLKAVLDRKIGLREKSILSHIALFQIPNQKKLLFLTDAAMNIAPNLKDKAAIIRNVVGVARKLGFHMPKIAVLAATEHINQGMLATIDAATLKQMNDSGQIKNCMIDGPMALDVAISKEAAKQKYVKSKVAGDVDILLVPTIEVGNTLYKSFVYFSNAQVASIVAGAKAPIVLPSRSDTAENKLFSLALAVKTTNH